MNDHAGNTFNATWCQMFYGIEKRMKVPVFIGGYHSQKPQYVYLFIYWGWLEVYDQNENNLLTSQSWAICKHNTTQIKYKEKLVIEHCDCVWLVIQVLLIASYLMQAWWKRLKFFPQTPALWWKNDTQE